MSQKIQLIAHGVLALGLLSAAAVLTALGHDGAPYFGALTGQLAALGLSSNGKA